MEKFAGVSVMAMAPAATRTPVKAISVTTAILMQVRTSWTTTASLVAAMLTSVIDVIATTARHFSCDRSV